MTYTLSTIYSSKIDENDVCVCFPNDTPLPVQLNGVASLKMIDIHKILYNILCVLCVLFLIKFLYLNLNNVQIKS